MNDVARLRAAIDAKAPLVFAVMDRAAVEARRDWWHSGAVGHWPGCPCSSCDLRESMRAE